MSVQKFLDKIKNGRYGADITDAIIGGIKKCYDDASVNHDNANMEVKMARGTHNTLNDRLDKSEQKLDETNAQLSHIEVKKSDRVDVANIQSQINALVLGAVGDGNNAEVVQARGNYALLNDRLNNNEFNLNLLQNTTKNFVNLFNLYDDGVYVEAISGELKPNSLVSTTKFIDVANIDSYIYTYVGKEVTHQMAFYNESYSYVSGNKTNIIGEWKIAIPEEAKYCKISFYNENLSDFYVKGETKIKKYIDNKINTVEVDAFGSSTIDLLNPLNSTSGGFIGSGYNNDTLGEWFAHGVVSQSEFIDVQGYNSIELLIPANATGMTHQWVFKNSDNVIFTGGWRKGKEVDVDTIVTIPIPQGTVSFSSAYVTATPIKIYLKKLGLTQRVEALERDNNSLMGKKLGIVGDSISTYNGYVPSGYAHFFPRGDVQSVDDTWWKKLIDETGMELCVNCSWSGSTITGDTDSTTNAYSGASEKRVNDLTKTDGTTPDIIIVYISINDFGKNNGVITGNKVGNEAITQNGNLSVISDSYVLLIKKLMTKYPKAKIYCTTIMSEQFASEMNASYANGYPNINPNDSVTLPTWNNMIREIANNMGCGLIDMAKCGINYFNLDLYTIDKLHPNIAGHELMFEQALKDIGTIG